MIQAVVFDMGGTLIPASGPPTAYKIHQKILHAHGVSRSLESIAAAHRKAEETLNIKQLIYLKEHFWIKFNSIVLEELDVKENRLKIAEAIDREWWSHLKPTVFPDVPPALNTLKSRNIKLGVISNCLENELKRNLEKSGLQNFFDITVGVDTFQSIKPEKTVFLQTLAQIGVAPDKALYVGDSLEADYEGAKKAGMKALLIDREDKVKDNRVEKIRSLNEIHTHL